jgi:hypothetical protein
MIPLFGQFCILYNLIQPAPVTSTKEWLEKAAIYEANALKELSRDNNWTTVPGEPAILIHLRVIQLTRPIAALPRLLSKITYSPLSPLAGTLRVPGFDELYPAAYTISCYSMVAVPHLIEYLATTDAVGQVNSVREARNVAIHCLIRIYGTSDVGKELLVQHLRRDLQRRKGVQRANLDAALDHPLLK